MVLLLENPLAVGSNMMSSLVSGASKQKQTRGARGFSHRKTESKEEDSEDLTVVYTKQVVTHEGYT
jgi:hypothetical protein